MCVTLFLLLRIRATREIFTRGIKLSSTLDTETRDSTLHSLAPISNFRTVLAVEGTWHVACGSYECPHKPRYEPFVPAPPGHTPHCAKPGQTFCETLEQYPRRLIEFLVEKYSFDISSILTNEVHYGFNAYREKPGYNYGYVQTIANAEANSSVQQGYSYGAPADNQRNPLHLDNLPTPQRVQPFSREWLTNKRTRRDTSDTQLYSQTDNPLLISNSHKRAKRQQDPNVISVCETNSQYVMPQAALNNRGNWKYIVNVPDIRETHSQLVRAETCRTTTCNGLCAVPQGYVSRCVQRYVQKRLVALEGSGDRLYNDIFWLPHGCACEIVQNF